MPARKSPRTSHQADQKACGSIYDLAQQTGLSTSTISRALNQRGRISQKTRLRVLAAARASGFKPRASVRQRTFALVVDRMRYATYGGFVTSMLAHLICELARYEISAEVYTEDNVNQLGTRFIDGVIALTWEPSTVAKLQALENVPIVVINRLGLEGASTVITDHFQGGKLVGAYFIRHGHQKIAFLGEERDWGSKQRVEGLRAAMEEHGIDPANLQTGFTEHQPVYGALRRLVSQAPTALFLGGEDLTIEAIYVLASILNVKAPKDISIIGLENDRVSQFVQPPLSSLAQPLDALAAETLKLLTQLVDGNETKPLHVVVQNKLIERESVAAITPETAI